VTGDDDHALIDEQIAYYDARAAEYDATSTPDDDPFAADADRIRTALDEYDLGGRVLEIAAGTGQWTPQLADRARELVVTDSSPAMLDLNRARVGERPNVRYRVADAFALEPSHAYDAVFFGFFLSHVPPGRFEPFWGVVEGLLAPGGRVIFVDEGDHGMWEEDWLDRAAGLVERRLVDGSRHRAVKVFWEPAELEDRLRSLGWRASVTASGPFYRGIAIRSS